MNKKRAWIVGCTAMSILGGAGSASARVIDKNQFKGHVAAVVCSSSETIDCGFGFSGTLQTDIFVSGEEFVAKFSEVFPPGPQNNLFVTARRINTCTNEFSASFGSLPNASQQSLQSATLQGVVQLKDFETEAPAGSASVAITLEGAGNIQKAKDKLHFSFEGPDGNDVVIMIRTKGDSRQAIASGTISIDGTPVSCSFSDATLMSTQSGDKTLEHP
jgi:hypothetical protein